MRRNSVKWFFCLDDGANQFALARVAVSTCLRQTRLRPHCLYSGDSPDVVRWLEAAGVSVFRHAVPAVAEAVRRCYDDPRVALAAYLRTDIPRFCEPGDEWVFYSDVDVMFVGDCEHLKTLRPAWLAMTCDLDPLDASKCNSGAILMNVVRLRDDHPNFVNWVNQNARRWVDWDQEAYRQYYVTRGLADELPLEYNWRPFWREDWAILEGNCRQRQMPLQLVHFQILKPWQSDDRFGVVKPHAALQVRDFHLWATRWQAASEQAGPTSAGAGGEPAPRTATGPPPS
jgi:lipopolysaccharide biosynthesis glycosyltransferase